jgi:hypothetical protein
MEQSELFMAFAGSLWQVSSTVATLLPAWSSRLSYEKSPNSWTVGGLATLGGVLWGSPSLMHSLQT